MKINKKRLPLRSLFLYLMYAFHDSRGPASAFLFEKRQVRPTEQSLPRAITRPR